MLLNLPERYGQLNPIAPALNPTVEDSFVNYVGIPDGKFYVGKLSHRMRKKPIAFIALLLLKPVPMSGKHLHPQYSCAVLLLIFRTMCRYAGNRRSLLHVPPRRPIKIRIPFGSDSIALIRAHLVLPLFPTNPRTIMTGSSLM